MVDLKGCYVSARGVLTVRGAAQDVEAKARLAAGLQREDADVLRRHRCAQQLSIGSVSVRGAWEELEIKDGVSDDFRLC